MTTRPSRTYTKRRILLGTIGMAVGGLIPLGLAIASLWGYLRRGYFLSRGGEPIGAMWGVLASGTLLLAGLGLVGYAFWHYRRHTKRET